LTGEQCQTGAASSSASRRPPRTIILHYSPAKAAWDWLILLLVIYVAVSTPYVAAFKTIQHSDPLVFLDLAVDVMFMADVIINFRTSFVQHGEVIVDAKLIASNYLRGWFLIDIVSAIPFDFVLSKTGASDVSSLHTYVAGSTLFNNFHVSVGLSYRLLLVSCLSQNQYESQGITSNMQWKLNYLMNYFATTTTAPKTSAVTIFYVHYIAYKRLENLLLKS